MSYTIAELTTDLIQRVGRLENAAGITLLSAVNSIQSMLAKRLLDRKSDLLVEPNSLSLSIPFYGCSATLPDGFISMAEKPKYQELYTDWMLGNVVSYNVLTGELVLLVTDYEGSDTLSSWNISTVPVPGEESQTISTSTTSFTVITTGHNATLFIDIGLVLSPGTSLYITSGSMPSGLNIYQQTMQPSYLTSDEDHDDVEWWSWYGLYGWNIESPSRTPKHYKIVNTLMYIRPYAIYPLIITGKYFGLPAKLISTSTLPFNGLFDEIFREGVVRIISKGISLVEMDQDFNYFLQREFDSVINSRMSIMDKTRTSHSNFM